MKALQTHGQQRTAFEKDIVFGDGSTDPNANLWTIDWRDHGLSYCSVYVVTPDNEWPCKIGISVAPRKRVMALQTSVWRPLKVAKCFYCQTVTDARTLEKKIHHTLTEDQKWLHGEWFDMKPKDAADMVEFSAMVLGVECSSAITNDTVAATVRSYIEARLLKPANFEKRQAFRHQSYGWE